MFGSSDPIVGDVATWDTRQANRRDGRVTILKSTGLTDIAWSINVRVKKSLRAGLTVVGRDVVGIIATIVGNVTPSSTIRARDARIVMNSILKCSSGTNLAAVANDTPFWTVGAFCVPRTTIRFSDTAVTATQVVVARSAVSPDWTLGTLLAERVGEVLARFATVD